MLRVLTFIGIILLIYSCAGSKLPEKTSLIHGGGFTGTETRYEINSKGEISKVTGMENSDQKAKKLSRESKQELNVLIKLLIENIPETDSPGNMYRTIQIQDKEAEYKSTWEPGYVPLRASDAVFNRILELISNQ